MTGGACHSPTQEQPNDQSIVAQYTTKDISNGKSKQVITHYKMKTSRSTSVSDDVKTYQLHKHSLSFNQQSKHEYFTVQEKQLQT